MKKNTLSLILLVAVSSSISLLLLVVLTQLLPQSNLLAPSNEQIGKVAADYLIDNPQVLIKASEALQEKQRQQVNQDQIEKVLANKQVLLDDKTPYIGNKNAKVAIIEFFDYQCGYCAKMSQTLQEMLGNITDVKLLLKETPIFAKRSEVSGYAAKMGIKVFSQMGSEAYNKYHHGVFELTQEKALTRQEIDKMAQSTGLSEMGLPETLTSTIETNLTLFSELGFKGTPALIVIPLNNPSQDTVSVINGYDVQALVNALIKAKEE
ncbi:thioredoxin domain-containing protein [Vibrio hepatarius]|uniref:DsbA family protein n=1 Tax=Vibrio hepatarius TaxID=171383 RepID=UPI001C086CE7|nr:thioredoxin domain-containing protein [Vibrio hepatarius]MBU2896773.1 thioredoxin domain-containing protein [Vibrio hepatarius]